jgi:ribosomal protein S19E (S16A)
MQKRKIQAQEALADMRSGMNYSDLMDKYDLSAKGLESLFQKLVNSGLITHSELSRRLPEYGESCSVSGESTAILKKDSRARGRDLISSQQAVWDIRSGMDDSAMMQKYKLSPGGLESLFEQLISAGAIDQSELEQRSTFSSGTVDLRGIQKEIQPTRKELLEDRLWRCPACNIAQNEKFETCPICGEKVT